MRRCGLTLLPAALLAASCGGADTPAHGATPAPRPIEAGVAVHFGQGWPSRFWTSLENLPATWVRDGVAWRLIEPMPGQYSFTSENAGFVRRMCEMGRKPILVLLPRHPSYDGGLTVHTPAARAAFAAYVVALADHLSGCLQGVQIGNEINGKDNMTGPAAQDRARSYTAILRDVYAAVKPRHPDLMILGGSTNAIGTGFLSDLFAVGALDFMDAVVVHPYRKDPANVDWELDRLRAAMAAHGPLRPIWANEFGLDTTDEAKAASYLAKMLMLMGAAGVEKAFWYALADQDGFPTLGLVRKDGTEKLAAAAYRYVAGTVLPGGPIERMNGAETDIFQFRAGTRQIIWGGPRSFSVAGSPTYRTIAGAVIAKPALIGEEPFVIEGGEPIALGPRRVMADSLTDYGRAPWSYFGKRRSEAQKPLGPVDWRFTTFIGHATLKPATINQLGLSPAGADQKAITLMIRYTAPQQVNGFATACFAKAKPLGDGLSFELLHNGNVVDRRPIAAEPVQFAVPVQLSAGDRLDFVFDPNAKAQADTIAYRLRIVTEAGDAARC